MYGRSFTKFPHFVPIGHLTWPPYAILVSDWLKFKKNFPLKLQGQMNCNFVGMMYGTSFTKYIHFMLIRHLTWPPKAILVSNWVKFYKSSAMKQQSQMNFNCRNDVYEVLYKVSSFRGDRTVNMPATGNSSF